MNIQYYFEKQIALINTNIFNDNRGSFTELYSKKILKKLGITESFVQDNYSISKKKFTIRGLHFQIGKMSQSKLIRVIRGSIYDVVVDIRKNSSTYGKYMSFKLKKNDGKLLYVSKNFAHGFCTLENNTEIFYKVSKYYSKPHEKTIIWNDEKLNIKWPNKNKPTLSDKDLKGLKFYDINK